MNAEVLKRAFDDVRIRFDIAVPRFSFVSRKQRKRWRNVGRVKRGIEAERRELGTRQRSARLCFIPLRMLSRGIFGNLHRNLLFRSFFIVIFTRIGFPIFDVTIFLLLV